MAFQIFLNDLFSYNTGTPGAIAYRPQIFSPIPLFQLGLLLLKQTGASTFQSLYQPAYSVKKALPTVL